MRTPLSACEQVSFRANVLSRGIDSAESATAVKSRFQ
jgi:hypothetical protein